MCELTWKVLYITFLVCVACGIVNFICYTSLGDTEFYKHLEKRAYGTRPIEQSEKTPEQYCREYGTRAFDQFCDDHDIRMPKDDL